MNKSPILCLLAVLTLSPAIVSCGSERQDRVTAADAVRVRAPASEQARAASGLSHLPRPESSDAFGRSLAKHYPRELVGVRPSTSVLVDVSLDASGRVQDVAVVDPPAVTTSSAALIEGGSNGDVVRAMPATVYDPAFGPAAVAALKEVRFHPARRKGQAVPFTVRMSVEFTSPST
jgi:outer membrane biosynthesis protein TonB